MGTQAGSLAGRKVLLDYYIRVPCEELAQNPRLPSQLHSQSPLEALLAVRSLRTNRGVGLDRYYLDNFSSLDGLAFNERQLDPQIVPLRSGTADTTATWNVRRPTNLFSPAATSTLRYGMR